MQELKRVEALLFLRLARVCFGDLARAFATMGMADAQRTDRG